LRLALIIRSGLDPALPVGYQRAVDGQSPRGLTTEAEGREAACTCPVVTAVSRKTNPGPGHETPPRRRRRRNSDPGPYMLRSRKYHERDGDTGIKGTNRRGRVSGDLGFYGWSGRDEQHNPPRGRVSHGSGPPHRHYRAAGSVRGRIVHIPWRGCGEHGGPVSWPVRTLRRKRA